MMVAGAGAACALVVMALMASGSIAAQPPQPSQSSSDDSLIDTGTDATPNASESETVNDLNDSSDIDEPRPDTIEDTENIVENLPKLHITDANFMTLKSDPDKLANSTASISGRVYAIVDQSSGNQILTTYRIHHQAIDSDESRAVVMYQQVKRSALIMPDVIVEDCIKIEGTVRGGIGDTNSLGHPIRIPIIDSQNIGEIECIDSAIPAVRTIDSSLTQSYAGVELKVERVQLAEGHLRIKVTANNAEGGDSVFLREKESWAEYQGRPYAEQNDQFLFRPYTLDPILPAETQVSGYLFFEPIVNYSGGPITFRIVIEKVGISESDKSTFILKI
jgi:hypothetical protein